MEIRMTDAAAGYLENEIKSKKPESGIRIFVAGIGWAGPSFGLALDEQKDTDNVYEVKGFKILFDKEESDYTKGFEIDYRKSIFGNRISIDQIYSTGRTCS